MTEPTHDMPNASEPPLVSRFANEAEMSGPIEFFLATLARQVEALAQALDASDHDDLRQLARHLKGAAGGYGFPDISDSAGEVEATLLDDEAEIAAVCERVEDLVGLCQRALRGSTNGDADDSPDEHGQAA